jgi:hypothetical protein
MALGAVAGATGKKPVAAALGWTSPARSVSTWESMRALAVRSTNSLKDTK